MRTCDTFRDDLKAYADGEVNAFRRFAIRSHLARCERCRKEIEQMEEMKHEMLAADAGGLSQSLRARILAGAAQAVADQPTGATARVPRWLNRRNVFVMAAAAVVLWFVVYPIVGSRFGSYDTYLATAGQPHDARQITSNQSDPYSGAFAPSVTPAPSTPLAHEVASTGGVGSTGSFGGSASFDNGRMANGAKQTISKPIGKNTAIYIAENAANYAGGHRGAPARATHREATMAIDVAHPESSSDDAVRLVKSAGGFVANVSVSTGSDDLKTASLSLRVPIERFDEVVVQLGKLGDVRTKNVSGEDITEQIGGQQHNIRELHRRLTDVRARLTTRMSAAERVQLNDEADSLKEQISSGQGQLQSLNKQADYSDISLQLNEKPKPAPAPKKVGFLDELNDTASDAVHSFVTAAKLPVLALVWVAAYSPIWIGLVIAYRFTFRR